MYEYDPACPPVVSSESQLFRLAKFFEPDAPARHIQIELPSIKMGDMRKFQRGVGLKMSPELRDVMNRGGIRAWRTATTYCRAAAAGGSG